MNYGAISNKQPSLRREWLHSSKSYHYISEMTLCANKVEKCRQQVSHVSNTVFLGN